MEKTYANTMSFKTLLAFLSLVACSACGQQAGESIRRILPTTPALEDPSLTEFLFQLMEQAYTIAAYDHSIAIEGKVQLMLNACDKAKQIDAKDPYATYEAAKALAKVYDIVALALEGAK